MQSMAQVHLHKAIMKIGSKKKERALTARFSFLPECLPLPKKLPSRAQTFPRHAGRSQIW